MRLGLEEIPALFFTDLRQWPIPVLFLQYLYFNPPYVQA
jgi:hypothetical protein